MSTAGRSSPSRRAELAVFPSLDRASAADLMQFATGDGRAAGRLLDAGDRTGPMIRYITILSDPGGMPEAPALAAALRRELLAAPPP